MKTELSPDSRPDPQLASKEEGRSQREGFSLSRVLFILSVPGLALGIYFSTLFLLNPYELWWLFASAPPDPPALSLSPMQTLEEIKKDLAEAQLTLGPRLAVDIKEQIYPILQGKKKQIVEIRIYQPVKRGTKDRFRLLQKIALDGTDEYVVKAAAWKYDEESRRKFRAKGNRYPFTQLQLVPGNSPSQGVWLTVVGKEGKTAFGQIFYFLPEPRAFFGQSVEWVNPNGKLPEWADFAGIVKRAIAEADLAEPLSDATEKKEKEPQLIVDRSIDFEPDFQVFQLEKQEVLSDPYLLRPITLNEGLGMPRIYNHALILASGGLWTPALEKMNALKAQLAGNAFLQEQYDLIAAHARVTAAQADKVLANSGQQALFLLVDGRWQEALKIADNSEFAAKSIAEMLKQYHPHIWERVQAMLKVQGSSEVKIWGSLALKQKQGLRNAANWLVAQSAATKEAIRLLNRFDLAPLAMKPQQFLGTIADLGKDTPGSEWFEAPSSLLAGQRWYAIDITVIRDENVWKNGPFPELSDRSPLAIWNGMGLEKDDTMTVTLTDSYGTNQSAILRARAIATTADGRVRLLASGAEELAEELKRTVIPALVTGGNFFNPLKGTSISLFSLDTEVAGRIVETIYRELQTMGQVSLTPEDFKRQLGKWDFQWIDVTGDKQADLVLEIDRSKIDVGDRYYPMVVAFDSNGRELFSNIAPVSKRRWIAILPGPLTGQILTEINGFYEVWKPR